MQATSYINSHISLPQDGFEGPEKRLEVVFGFKEELSDSTSVTFRGLRTIPEADWQVLLDLAKCTIISSTSNDFLDSFVLSESSLFVYPNKIILKTCGTTTLLNCLDKLIEYGERVGANIKFVIFSRKNFNYPHKQLHPHSNFETEVQILNEKFHGSAHVLGPVLSGVDHHFIYFANLLKTNILSEELQDLNDEWTESKITTVIPECKPSRPTVEILMSQLDPIKMQQFYRNENFVNAKTTTSTVGLANILQNMTTDEVVFEPCGYSLNAINPIDGSYATVHVTPEPHCSFVSFETDVECSNVQRNILIQSVVETFRPGRFSVVITSDHPLPPLEAHHRGYSCKFKTQYEFEEGFYVLMQNYVPTNNGKRSLAASYC
jgi:S-adenosylmethionine decarboxylase